MYRSIIRISSRPLATGWPALTKRYASSASHPFDWEDPLAAKTLFTEEELAIWGTTQAYCQERLAPRVIRRLILYLLRGKLIKIGRGISRRALR